MPDPSASRLGRKLDVLGVAARQFPPAATALGQNLLAALVELVLEMDYRWLR